MVLLKVEKLDTNLDGIVYRENISIKVPFCKIGDMVDVLEIDDTNKIPIAKKVILQKDSHQSPLCEYFYQCGGCKLQHFTQQEYIQIKLNLVQESFKKSNINYQIDKNNFYHHLDNPVGHRRRVEFSVDKKVIGFKEYKTNKILPIRFCPLLKDNLNIVLKEFSKIISEDNNILNITSINLTQIGDYIDVLIVSSSKSNLETLKILQPIFQSVYIARIYWKYKNSIEPIVVKNNLVLSYQNYKVDYHINTFLQAEDFGENLIIKFILKHLADSEKILDLFCGYGSYALSLVNSNTILIKCVDIELKAIESLNKLNHKIIKGYIQDIFKNPVQSQEINNYEAIIINPPRNGALLQIQELVKSNMKKIVMVYCSISSLARDLQILLEGNKYYIADMIIVDQFIFTKHLEIIVFIEKY